jgi:hypothetical protein
MIGRIPAVLKMRIKINQAKWLLRADFQRPIAFQMADQIANKVMRVISG